MTRPSLFEPFAVGPLTLKNRVVFAPMTTLLDLDEVGRYEAFYVTRAAGGVAMVTLNLQALFPGMSGRTSPRAAADPAAGLLALNHDRYVARLAQLTGRIHAHGCLTCAQLAVGATWCPDGPDTAPVTVSPSGLVPEGPAFRPDVSRLPFFPGGRPAGIDELSSIQGDIAVAAIRAVRAGFDAVQLTAAGGSLLGQFLSPLLNRRDDRYGGELPARARLLVETATAVRAVVGSRVPVLCRMNGDDLVPGGMTATDYAELVPLLEDAGIDAIDIMPGGFVSRVPVNQDTVPQGAFVYVSETLKRRARVPVAAGTRVTDAALAETIVADGRADFVSLGTALIADPDWADKARTGRLDDIRPCTACCSCWNDLAEHHRPIACAVNPEAGLETRFELQRAARPRRVTVVGAGPAGMTAAITAARLGHRVMLFDRQSETGGLLNVVVRLPHRLELRTFAAFLRRQLKVLGVDVRLSVEVTPTTITAVAPDAVIVATGRLVRAFPDVTTIDGRNAATCVDLLTGAVVPGDRVVLIGGGRESCETAEWLADQGRHVVIVALSGELAEDVGAWNRWVMLDRLASLGVRAVAGATAEVAGPADTMVVSGPWQPDSALLSGLSGPTTVIGAIPDGGASQSIGDAIRAGFLAALAL